MSNRAFNKINPLDLEGKYLISLGIDGQNVFLTENHSARIVIRPRGMGEGVPDEVESNCSYPSCGDSGEDGLEQMFPLSLDAEICLDNQGIFIDIDASMWGAGVYEADIFLNDIKVLEQLLLEVVRVVH